MHGEIKLRAEGVRTRDGHLMEWFSRLGVDEMHVSSRPEPWPRRSWHRARHPLPLGSSAFRWHSPQVLQGVLSTDRRTWWEKSSRSTAVWGSTTPDAAISWNPFAAAAIGETKRKPPLALDLIDDWTNHHQFAGICDSVAEAYRRSFEIADLVFANSEGTMRLARRFGRDDAQLILNGVDPDRFSAESAASGPTTIGYAGKISERIDVQLIRRAVEALPQCRFEIAGQGISRAVVNTLRRIPGLALLGDIHYRDYPRLLSTWDIGWIPHRIGAEGEIGGDVIKLYEYRAAGLPTFMTPIEGAGRGLSGVRIHTASDLVTALVKFVGANNAERIPREPTSIPTEMTWQSKAGLLLDALGRARI